MTGLIWLVVASAFLIIVVRRPAMAVALLVVQSIALAALAALQMQDDPDLRAATVVLAAKAIVLAVVLTMVLRRTRESRPVHASLMPSARALLALGVVGALMLVAPAVTVGERMNELAAVTLIGVGFCITMLRRATLVQIVGIVVAENGVVVAALGAATPVPFVIELGVAIDVMLIAFVATALHERIQIELGAGDAGLLQDLHD